MFLSHLSLDICSKMLQMIYQSVVASVLFYAAVCWGGSTMTYWMWAGLDG